MTEEIRKPDVNYFVCTYGRFPEQGDLVERSLRDGVYLLHQYARYPSAIREIRQSDILFLNIIGTGIVAYGVAQDAVQHSQAADSWNYVLRVKNGWHYAPNKQVLSAYGISWATLIGGQFSLVKKVKGEWANTLLAAMGFSESKSHDAQKRVESCDDSYRCSSPGTVAEELMKGTLEIPPVQRDLVWSATRLEVLWDSILRDIPIGTFSIRAAKKNSVWTGHWELLDGQQRAHSIMAAYRPYPPEPTFIEAPVVWLDLLPNKDKMYGRKYVFRVTTAAHPWGYHLNDDEANNSKIQASKMRDLSSQFDWARKNPGDLLSCHGKPYPCELVPIESNCPIPFSLIWECCRTRKKENTNQKNPSWNEFIDFCLRKSEKPCIDGVHPWNWLDRVRVQSGDEIFQSWDELVKRVDDLEDYVILQVNAKSVDSRDEVGTYFKRIGRGGEVPSQEEMNYSMLKARLDSLKKSMDALSVTGWAAPARMATIAIRAWKERQGLFGTDTKIVNEICANEQNKTAFSEYTTCGTNTQAPTFETDLKHIEKLFGIEENGDIKENGLLPWHKMVFCTTENGAICQHLLRLIAKGSINQDINPAGLASFLFYYSNNVERIISKYLNRDGEYLQNIADAYRASYWNKPLLRRVVLPTEIDCLIDKVNCDDWIGSWQQINSDPAWQPIVNLLVTGYGSLPAYSILLFACRDFMKVIFPNYNALLPIWSEENCPWDYDHIFPRSWKDDIETIAKGVGKIIDSIGNLAPLPFSLNRAKQDDIPTEAYPLAYLDSMGEAAKQKLAGYQKDLLLCNKEGFLKKADADNKSAFIKANIKSMFLGILQRFRDIYGRWFEELGIEHIIPKDFSRKPLFDELMRRLSPQGYGTWIPKLNGQERRLEANPFPFSDIDWIVTPWITFGKPVGDYFIAYRDDGKGKRIMGLCKLPEEACPHPKPFQSPCGFIAKEHDDYWYANKSYDQIPTADEVQQELEKLEKYVLDATTR